MDVLDACKYIWSLLSDDSDEMLGGSLDTPWMSSPSIGAGEDVRCELNKGRYVPTFQK
jgi:hypothetical protein